MSSWRVVADLDLCQGHQECRLDGPDLFGFDRAADKVVLLSDQPSDDLRGQADAAVAGCPSMALAIVENPVENPVEG